jgi:hypothetical protein
MVEGECSRSRFVFIHLYDAHRPYLHGSYDAEISYIDKAIGRLQQSLEARKILQGALIVLTSDHGESLGEHGEETHGYFIYESTLWRGRSARILSAGLWGPHRSRSSGEPRLGTRASVGAK